MECEICMESFDEDVRRPKVLPCGHSACLPCLLQLAKKECSVCRKIFPATETLPDNYIVLKLMDNVAVKSKKTLWCMECGGVATAVCEEEHSMKGINKALQQQVGQMLQQLQKSSQQLQEMTTVCTEEQILEALNVLWISKGSYEVSLRRQDGYILKGSLDPSSTGEQNILYDTIVKILAFILIKNGFSNNRGQDNDPPADVCSPPQTSASNPDNVPSSSGTGRPDALVRQPAEPVIEFLDVGWITTQPSGTEQQLKRNLLERVQRHGVRRLVNVFCVRDEDWAESLLKAAAPRLEVLEVVRVSRQHLMTMQGMPRLWYLAVTALRDRDADLFNRPPHFPTLPSSHHGLQRLKAWKLPRDTVLSLLNVHAGTLEEVHLLVGTPGSSGWPYSCSDLHEELRQCNLNKLIRVVLWRTGHCSHTSDTCLKQLKDLRDSLPNQNVSVVCSWCSDYVPWGYSVLRKIDCELETA